MEATKAELCRRWKAGATIAALSLEFRVSRSFVRMVTRKVRRETQIR